jgi:phosphoribosyl 1,2-cyclic phosphodiesterase
MEICSLASGSSGNSYLIRHGATSLLLDAGLSGKRIAQGVEGFGGDPRKLLGILITHEHSDHIQGAGIMSRRYNLPLYLTQGTWQEGQVALGSIAQENLRLIQPGSSFSVGDLEVTAFSVRHDAKEPVAYSFSSGKLRAAILTDVGKVEDSAQNLFPDTTPDAQINSLLRECHCLVLEANHDPKMLAVGSYPHSVKRRIAGDYGHLSNLQAAQILLRLFREGKLRMFTLAHLSANNNLPALAAETVTNYLENHGVAIGSAPVLSRDGAGPALQII